MTTRVVGNVTKQYQDKDGNWQACRRSSERRVIEKLVVSEPCKNWIAQQAKKAKEAYMSLPAWKRKALENDRDLNHESKIVDRRSGADRRGGE